jgi:T5SS/PEP-CTERM-associated repeat protein
MSFPALNNHILSPMRSISLAALVLSTSIASLQAAAIISAGSGNWEAASPNTWTPPGDPQTGSIDDVSILTGHTVIWTGGSAVGLNGSGDLGVANGHSININGGILSQTPVFYWVRIGHETDGTMNINDGRFHFTNSVGNNDSPSLQVGIRGASGFINVGDGTGAAGSAVMNLRDRIDGTSSNVNVSLNLGAEEGGFTPGLAGTVIVKSDGLLEGDNGTTRIGQAGNAAHALSTLSVQGGLYRAHGTVEAGSLVTGADRSNGLLSITGATGRMEQDAGELVIGWNGDGAMVLDTGGIYSKTDAPNRGDIYIGRDTTGIGSVTVQNGGQLLRGPGGNVGDLRIGFNGTGTMTINDGGLVRNESGNWDWIGENNGSNGTLRINAGGVFETVGATNFNIGVNSGATGLVIVNGGTLDLQNAGGAQMRIGENGTGTFRQISGITNTEQVIMAQTNGTATFDLQGGTFRVGSAFFMGGNGAGSPGTGTATATQSGGTLSSFGSIVVGLAPAHTASYALTGGEIVHNSGDITVGESGAGTMSVGISGTLTDNSGGSFFVGRNDGSSGSLIVDGTLSRIAGNAIRVGNGNPDGLDNTTGTGVLGGTGNITALGGVQVGTRGTLTGGTLASVGTLNLTGNMTFSINGTWFTNFNSTGGSDRIALTGLADISGAVLDGDWTGGQTGAASRYWLLVNDDVDPITGSFGNVSTTSQSNSTLFSNADGYATIDGQEFAVFYSGDFATNAFTGGNDLLLAAVPEPSTAALICGALGFGLLRRRRSAA